jgi:DNA-binding transcriptional LysR family regulator
MICYYLIHMKEPVETSEMLAFTKTIDARSLSRAAAELGVPRATLSRRLARLEERLGVRLLRRTTRSLALTDAGETFYQHASVALSAIDNAEESVRRTDDAIRGPVRVSLPPTMDDSFYELLTGFATTYPDVRVYAHFSSALVDLVRGGYDVAIRATQVVEPGLVARTLVKSPLVAVASPAYTKTHGTPRTVRDLRTHRCIVGYARGELPLTHWPLKGGGKVPVDGVFYANEMTLIGDAAVRGLGIALMPLIVAGPLIQRGDLVHVLSGIVEADTRVSIVYAEREFVPPQVRAFIDAVVAWAPNALGPRLQERCTEHLDRRARRKAGSR